MSDDLDRSGEAEDGETRGAEPIKVEPSVLVWARKSIGFDETRAAKKIGVVPATLQNWESGATSPSLAQLRRISTVYKRPLVVLLLPQPAKDFAALRDFRSGLRRAAGARSPELTAEYWRALSQRDVLMEIADLGGADEGVSPMPGTTLEMSEEDAGRQIRDWLGVPTRWPGSGRALAGWIDAVEARGILVVQTQRVEPAEMRGFSVSAWPHPIAALNGSEFPAGRLFTLAHELAHLSLNAGGLCDLHEERDNVQPEDRIELYCNRVAAAALMPRDAFYHIRSVSLASVDKRWTTAELATIAEPFGTSAESMLLRLITLGKAKWDLYWALKPEFESGFVAAKAAQRQSEGGPTFYMVKARDLGHGYIRTVMEAFRGRTISSLDVANYLDVRYEQIPKLEQAAR